MAIPGSFLVYRELGIFSEYGCSSQPKALVGRGTFRLLRAPLSSHALRQDAWSRLLLSSTCELKSAVSTKYNVFQCRSFLAPSGSNLIPVLKSAAEALTRSYNALHGRPTMLQLVPAVGIIAFAAWGLGPLMRLTRIIFLRKSDSSWSRSSTQLVTTSYVRPLLLWTGAILMCRVLDPIILPTEASQAVKQRAVNFIRSLSTVLASAYCLSSLIQQSHKFFMELNDDNDTRIMGFQFATKAVYTAVWVAAVSLFMELLGFSTQKWVTAGGLGTVLLTLAGREIFTNFLSSVMIHATRPFVVNEWIQTKIGGMEVSGTVEHVGWWSPTVIRGDDREAIHIPNHKFTMNVVRNLTQKSHWRIKTHLAISHLDVNKINNIVADMRKVLGKNPQVEQQKLHRRVFLESINPENQALMILVSCFVKTSRFEEYLCVKEAIMLDLLRVISHHRARLATPIRTIQKTYRDPDIEDVPFGDTFSGSRPARNRPMILVEASYKTQSGDQSKASLTNEEKDAKVDVKSESTPSLDEAKAQSKVPPVGTNSTDSSKAALEPKTSDATKLATEPPPEKTELPPPAASPGKQGGERPVTQPPPPHVLRPGFEDNIVLGVALDGSKRTLPIEEEEMTSSATNSAAETKGLAAAARNGGGSGAVSVATDDSDATTRSDQREKGR